MLCNYSHQVLGFDMLINMVQQCRTGTQESSMHIIRLSRNACLMRRKQQISHSQHLSHDFTSHLITIQNIIVQLFHSTT